MKHIILFLCIVACTKELKYSKEEILRKATQADASATVILPKTMTDGVPCTDYEAGCLATHIVQVRKLNFIAIEFVNEEKARRAAKKIRGYYTRNWVFDDVTGEPILERFVEDSLEAKKP